MMTIHTNNSEADRRVLSVLLWCSLDQQLSQESYVQLGSAKQCDMNEHDDGRVVSGIEISHAERVIVMDATDLNSLLFLGFLVIIIMVVYVSGWILWLWFLQAHRQLNLRPNRTHSDVHQIRGEHDQRLGFIHLWDSTESVRPNVLSTQPGLTHLSVPEDEGDEDDRASIVNQVAQKGLPVQL